MPIATAIAEVHAKTVSRAIARCAEARRKTVRNGGATRRNLRHSEVTERTQISVWRTSQEHGVSQQRGTSPQVQNQDQDKGAAGPTAQSVALWQQQGPNLSFNRTRHGVRPWPRGAVVHDAPRGQGRTPRHAG